MYDVGGVGVKTSEDGRLQMSEMSSLSLLLRGLAWQRVRGGPLPTASLGLLSPRESAGAQIDRTKEINKAIT